MSQHLGTQVGSTSHQTLSGGSRSIPQGCIDTKSTGFGAASYVLELKALEASMPPWERHAVTRPDSCRWGRAGWVVSYRRIILRAKMTQGSVQKSTHYCSIADSDLLY